MCRKMFVRDSPAPTVGQKLVGGDCQVRCSNMFSNNFHCTDPFQVNISLQATKSNGRNCRGKLRDFVLDWEAELPQEVLPSDAKNLIFSYIPLPETFFSSMFLIFPGP